jgi:hypothetical protein
MIKIAARVMLLFAILSVMSMLIPDTFSASIDGAIQYMIGQLYVFNPLFDVGVLLTCLWTLANFLFLVATFYLFTWFVRVTGGTD